MNSSCIKKVVIAGGGTAGWMAAAALSKLLSNDIDVFLVESDEIATVGVGEATIPTLLTYHKLLDIDEREFMMETHATFKLGIEFSDWLDKGESYIHSFGSVGEDNWAAGFHHYWRKACEEGFGGDYGGYCLELEAAKQGKFAHSSSTRMNYAYHLDATLYAKFLRRYSEKKGVSRIEGEIVDVKVNDGNGFIESLKLASGESVSGDLFIDCTGFRGLLIEQALHTGYEDWSNWLPCDRAIAVQTRSTAELPPYTRSVAHEAGWQWRIPLQSRVGNGLVYCSNYMSDQDARRTLLDNLDAETVNEPRIIKFKTGQRLKHWNKNCVALGLASGFIEPLESTSIHLIMRGILRLIHMFPANGIHKAEVAEFNTQSRVEAEHIRDFIILHYNVTQKRGSKFWEYCQNMSIPYSLRHRIDLFVESGRYYRNNEEMFGEHSWVQIMFGQGLVPKSYHPVVDVIKTEELKTFLESIRNPIARALIVMPSHRDYIERYCNYKGSSR